MPTNLVKTEADEAIWNKAKAQAKEAGEGKNWAYITSIFKSMKGGSKVREAAKVEKKKRVVAYEMDAKERAAIKKESK